MKIGYKIAALSACVLGSVCIVGVASFISVEHMIDINRWVNHTELVLRKMEDLEELVARADTATRGFVITDDEHYEKTFRDVQNELRVCTNDVRKLVSDNPEQLKILDQFELALTEKTGFQEKLILTEKTRGYAESIKVFKNQGPLEPDREVRDTITRMQRIEDDLLQHRLKKSAEVANNAVQVVVLGTIFGAVMMIVVGFKIAHDLTLPIERLIRAVEKVGRGRLDPVVGIDSKDEMEDLAVAFNQMGLAVRAQIESLADQIAVLKSAQDRLALLHVQMGNFDSVANDLTAATRELTAGAAEDQCTIDISSAGAGELTDNVQSILSSVQTALNQLSDPDSLWSEIARASSDEERVLDLAVSELSRTIDRLQQFSHPSKELLEMLSSSENFAMNLKLLSLSTAMESARDSSQSAALQALVGEARSLSEQATSDLRQLRLFINLQQETARAVVADVTNLTASVSRQKRTATRFSQDAGRLGQSMNSLKERLTNLSGTCLAVSSTAEGLKRGLDQLNLSMRQHRFCVTTVQRTAGEIESFGGQLKKLADPNTAVPSGERLLAEASLLERAGGV